MTPDAANRPPNPCDLRSLRYAEHFCIWAIRTSVACSPQCRTLLREFESAFGSRAADGMSAWRALMEALAGGARRLRIGRPGLIQLTHDETSLARMLAAAQAHERDLFMAHARWIMGHERLDDLYDEARRFTGLLRERGHICALPEVCAGAAAERGLIAL